MSRLLAILLAFAGINHATRADAQHVLRRGQAIPVVSGGVAYPGGVSTSAAVSAPSSVAQPGRVYTYSYYTRSPLPPRTYVGYGTDDFAYHGRPYGHPYDPWTWPMMTGAYGNGLARYYDPPVK